FGIKSCLITAGQMAPPPNYYSCFVAMAQTLTRRITPKHHPKEWDAWFRQFSIVIVDEAHRQVFNPFFTERPNLFNGAQI
ncbi:hypothetical protein NL524_31435, partial [Klebsiella pneumoniae]|nr:hypothetical protein [Klebsiella pneumoniae]